MSVPHPLPYQGSKRGLAPIIVSYFPPDVDRLIEPFAGSAAVSLAAAYTGKARRFHLNDANAPLMSLWDELINRPHTLAQAYTYLWHEQQGQEQAYYNQVRDQFNQTQQAPYLLYLLARCVKAAVRYNANGQFNQSPDNRRQGAHPTTMRQHIFGAAQLLKERTVLTARDYRVVLQTVGPGDLVYMDPPYQGVCGHRDPRYLAGLDFDSLIATLQNLNKQSVSYILSYDGRTGAKQFGKPLPPFLGLTQIELDAGRSSQATLLGRSSRTYESLYLSPALVARPLSGGQAQQGTNIQQLALLEILA